MIAGAAELDRRAHELQERRLVLDVLLADRSVCEYQVLSAVKMLSVPSVTMNGGS